jgi:multisite-specific tRNA:(cytosine-C5)-methyltransferase
MFGLLVDKCVFTIYDIVLIADSKAMSDPTKADASTIAIGCWKGRSKLSVMVTAIDCQK